jgi:hypothetical protein
VVVVVPLLPDAAAAANPAATAAAATVPATPKPARPPARPPVVAPVAPAAVAFTGTTGAEAIAKLDVTASKVAIDTAFNALFMLSFLLIECNFTLKFLFRQSDFFGSRYQQNKWYTTGLNVIFLKCAYEGTLILVRPTVWIARWFCLLCSPNSRLLCLSRALYKFGVNA